MVVETKKENLCINQLIAQKNIEAEIEGDVIIPDIKPDILNAINSNGTVCVYKKEVMDGKIRLDGSINLYIMYMPDSENDSVRSLNTSLDFTQIIDIDEARENMTMQDDIKISSIECKILNGRKININVNYKINIKLYSNDNIEIINELEDIPDIQMLNSKLEVNSLIGIGTTKVYAKENVSIDNIDEIAEIMKVELRLINKDIKISYNKVLAKADLDVKIMYLTEDNRINTAQSQIPVMGFVDIPNVSEENICDIDYSLKNLLVKPNTAETHGIYVEAQIELMCASYERKEINIIQDLYSPSRNVEFNQKRINAMTEKQNIQNEVNISEQVQIPEMIGHRLIDVEINPRVNTANILNDKIAYDGSLELKFMYETEGTSSIEIKVIELPLNTNIDAKGISKKSTINTNISVSSQDFIIGQNGTIDCKINLNFEVNVSKTTEINIIEGLNVEEDTNTNNYSMTIYFVKQGDTLWKIAKKFKSTVEDIAEVNEIEDVNKISIGEQLFIPKYMARKIG